MGSWNEATLAFCLDAVTAWQVGWEPGYHRSQLVGLEMDGIMVDAMLPAESQGILTPLLLFIENLFLSNFDMQQQKKSSSNNYDIVLLLRHKWFLNG